ncbi:Gfo/Idh/MocA family protein [uncultured Ruthenibacterium sp.]|uniref:Gfo/Idh/MocA family protein n=1 Tax=uncultured Ruthenibacterium sp. TaxID=1905347 RepID=UPI00349E5F1A
MGSAILDRFKTIRPDEDAVVDPQRKLRVGIIGTGWIAEAHVESLLRCPDAQIVAAADLEEGKAARFFEKMGVEGVHCYTDHVQMLDTEHLDVVSVCTYNTAHAVCTIDALRRGVHVLCEKPISATLADAQAMCRAEKESGKLLSIGVQPRMSKAMQTVKEIVQSGELGKVYYVQSGGGRRRGIPTPFGTSFIEKDTAGVGAMGDIGCYSLDMLLNALGYPKPLTVTGYKSAFFGTRPDSYPAHPEYAKLFGVDDFAAAFIRLSGDIVLDFRIAWAMNMDTLGDALILGTKGGLRIPSTECWNGSVGGPLVVYHQVGGQQVQTVLPYEEEDTGELFYKKIRAFLNAVKSGSPAPVPSREMLYNQAIVDAIQRSAELGREVQVEIPEI